MRTDDWESVARESVFQKALTTKHVDHEGRDLWIDIVKPLHGDPVAYYADTVLEVPRYKVSSSEIDKCHDWRPY